jgi:ribosomal protein S6
MRCVFLFMKIYELNLHLSTKLDEKDRGVVWGKIKKVIETEKAEILEEGSFRQIELAYPIKKEIYSFYGHLFFRALPETILVLKELLLHEKAILRYLIFTHKSISRRPVSTRMSRRKNRVTEEKRKEVKEGVDETGKAYPRSASLGLEKPVMEKEKPVIKKKTVKKKKKQTTVKKEAGPRSASLELERPKKEPKFKLEDIDKSLEKLLEKEL